MRPQAWAVIRCSCWLGRCGIRAAARLPWFARCWRQRGLLVTQPLPAAQQRRPATARRRQPAAAAAARTAAGPVRHVWAPRARLPVARTQRRTRRRQQQWCRQQQRQRGQAASRLPLPASWLHPTAGLSLWPSLLLRLLLRAAGCQLRAMTRLRSLRALRDSRQQWDSKRQQQSRRRSRGPAAAARRHRPSPSSLPPSPSRRRRRWRTHEPVCPTLNDMGDMTAAFATSRPCAGLYP